MTEAGAIIGLADWLETPEGQYLLAWEQTEVNRRVVDIFGFHALQLGLPQLQSLRDNRMPHRWVAVESLGPPAQAVVALQCDFDALPLDSQSLDLVVLPHTLELARDPHLALREVERVLRPEGRVLILGFNPASLWGMRQRWGHMRGGAGLSRGRGLFMPTQGEFIGYRRLRDWLRLLSFDIEAGCFGCYRPPLRSETWLARFAWMEQVGAYWWPVFGAVYSIVAVKRVRGMRLVGLARQRHRAKAKQAAAVVNGSGHYKDINP